MSQTYLTRKEKLAYGFGDNGLSMSYTIISFFFLFYLTDVAGLNPALAGGVVLIGKLCDAITDPLVGYLSDRTTTKWGRRRPYFLFSSIPFGVSFFLLWVPIPFSTQLGLFVYNSLLYVLFTTSYTLFAVPYMSLTPELTPNYDERTNLTAYRMAFSIIAGLVAVVIPQLIVHSFATPQTGFMIMGAIFGILITTSPLSVFFGTKERVSGNEDSTSFFQGVSLTLKNRPFLIALAIFLFTWGAIDIISAVFIYFIKYCLLLEGYDSAIFGALFISAVVQLPLWVKISEKYGKRMTYLIGIGSMIVVLFPIFLLGAGQLTGVFVLAILAGAGVSVAHVIPYSILPDCIDYGQSVTGKRMEGIYYGFTTFARKVTTSISIFIIGQVLNWTGYVANQTQNTATIWAIRSLIGPAAALVLALGIIFMLKFPIDRASHQAIINSIQDHNAAM